MHYIEINGRIRFVCIEGSFSMKKVRKETKSRHK